MDNLEEVKPIAWRCEHQHDTKQSLTTYDPEWARRFGTDSDFVVTPLYSAPPAPANSLAIAQAALEAGAVIAESFCACDSSIEQEAVDFTAKNKAQRIRAINPQSILDGMSK